MQCVKNVLIVIASSPLIEVKKALLWERFFILPLFIYSIKHFAIEERVDVLSDNINTFFSRFV